MRQATRAEAASKTERRLNVRLSYGCVWKSSSLISFEFFSRVTVTASRDESTSTKAVHHANRATGLEGQKIKSVFQIDFDDPLDVKG